MRNELKCVAPLTPPMTGKYEQPVDDETTVTHGARETLQATFRSKRENPKKNIGMPAEPAIFITNSHIIFVAAHLRQTKILIHPCAYLPEKNVLEGLSTTRVRCFLTP